MPQLSPMMGVIIFLFVLTLYFIFFCGISKKPAKVVSSKVETSKKPSLMVF
uniref:ATP synthase F0 subunit 8 n=1 Tax=Tritoniopsis elegans TaxID=1707732 RepID=UPI002551E4EE|nr:ATP synthase F0 subunit 8 [Tritoniopsis elegans]WGM82655.1 ATP synthase subunit 8 [Tritoniopsis elegans]